MAPQFDRELRKLLREAGCVLIRQGRGSHEVWQSPITRRNFAVPVGIPSRHTANAILRQAGLRRCGSLTLSGTLPVVNIHVLAGRRILLIEDEPLVALLAADYIVQLGGVCLGPIGNLADALAAARTSPCDAAVINLVIQGQHAYAVVEALAERGVPFGFASGVPRNGIDTKWRNRPYLSKPYSVDDMQKLLLEIFTSAASSEGPAN